MAKKDGKNVTNTTETDKEEVRTEKHSYTWKGSGQIARVSSTVRSGKMRPHREQRDACFVNRIWTGAVSYVEWTDAFVVIALRMGSWQYPAVQ